MDDTEEGVALQAPEKDVAPVDDSSSEEEVDLKKHEDKRFKEYELDTEKYPVRECHLELPYFSRPVSFNPLVSLLSIAVLWGIAIWSIGE